MPRTMVRFTRPEAWNDGNRTRPALRRRREHSPPFLFPPIGESVGSEEVIPLRLARGESTRECFRALAALALFARNHAAPDPAAPLRTVPPPLPAPAPAVEVVAPRSRTESFELTATRQGIQVVQLLAEDRGSSYVVRCLVHPAGA